MNTETKDSPKRDLLSGAKACANILALHKLRLNSPWQRVRALGYLALAGASVYIGLYGLCVFKDKQLKLESTRAQQKYTRLEKLADFDSDGQLSDIERLLLFERLDKKQLSPEIPWKVIQHSSNVWDYATIYRIEQTIKLYEEDYKTLPTQK